MDLEAQLQALESQKKKSQVPAAKREFISGLSVDNVLAAACHKSQVRMEVGLACRGREFITVDASFMGELSTYIQYICLSNS